MPSIPFQIPERATAEAVEWLAPAVKAAGGRALLVGGCVRDMALGRPAIDIDIEVYGVQPADLQALVAARYPVDLVGKAFGVLKLRRLPIDVAIPRRETKSGTGHKGFAIESDPNMGFRAAAGRRDFTINAIGYDPLSGEVLDPYNGLADLEQRVLRHVSGHFKEDPLRVLRGMQFVARFLLNPARETIEICQRIEPEGLPAERIFDEWRKLLLLGVEPSRGLAFLEATAWVRLFPELDALIGCPQEKEWHPEGDVWTHTGHVLDAFARERVGDEWEDLVVGLAALCHDLGKPATTKFEEGRIRSRGHDRKGIEFTRQFLQRITNHHDLIEQVIPLVQHHHRPSDFFRDEVSDSAIRRLACKVGRLDRLVRVARADSNGRPPMRETGFPEGDWLLARAEALRVADQAPTPLVMGRHLIQMGLKPGPRFGQILETCFDAQLEGVFTDLDGGLAHAQNIIAKSPEP